MKQIPNILNENEGVITAVIFIATIFFTWFTGLWKLIRNAISKNNRAKKIICAWRIYPSKFTEFDNYVEYRFGPIFHNKNDEIIRDFWINFSSSGFNLHLEETPQMISFDGWNMRNEALNLTLKDDKKFAPQNFFEPFIIVIKLNKDLPIHSAWIYISYGVSNSPKNEINYQLSYFDLKKFVDGNKHSTENFLEYIGAKGFNFFKKRMIRIFWRFYK